MTTVELIYARLHKMSALDFMKWMKDNEVLLKEHEAVNMKLECNSAESRVFIKLPKPQTNIFIDFKKL